MSEFKDTEGNSLVVGETYTDHEGDILVVDCNKYDDNYNEEYIDVTYKSPIDAWGGLVRYYVNEFHNGEVTFTKGQPMQETPDIKHSLELFKDTEGNSILKNQRYTDNEGYTFVVTEVNDNEMICQYDDKFQGLNGIVRWNAHNIDMFGAYFTKGSIDVSPFQKVSEAAATSVSPKRLEAAVGCSDESRGTKNDSGKLRFDLLPADSIQEVVQVITYGETKYPSVEIQGKKVQNWRVLPDNENRLFAATMRHLWQHRSGEVLDQETKMKHLAHAASSLMFLIAIENEKLTTKGNQ
jgi:Domain of unknown function (DUF5664)